MLASEPHVHFSLALHTDSLLHQLRRHRGVNAARDGADDLGRVSDQVSYPDNLLLDKVLHDPAVLGAADVDGKVAQDLGSARGLHMELSVPWPGGIDSCC